MYAELYGLSLFPFIRSIHSFIGPFILLSATVKATESQ